MRGQEERQNRPDKRHAAVCGLYCEACSWFIASAEDPERLSRLAAQFGWTVEEARCEGCRSEKRIPYCAECKLAACAAERGVDFCSECHEYPCTALRDFQAAMPHRIELWVNLGRIKAVGWEEWMNETRQGYLCPECRTVNSAYDLKCRKCGEDPSCRFVGRHKPEIEQFMRRR